MVVLLVLPINFPWLLELLIPSQLPGEHTALLPSWWDLLRTQAITV